MVTQTKALRSLALSQARLRGRIHLKFRQQHCSRRGTLPTPITFRPLSEMYDCRYISPELDAALDAADKQRRLVEHFVSQLNLKLDHVLVS